MQSAQLPGCSGGGVCTTLRRRRSLCMRRSKFDSVGRRLAPKGVLGCNLPLPYCFCVGFALRVNKTRVSDRLYLYG